MKHYVEINCHSCVYNQLIKLHCLVYFSISSGSVVKMFEVGQHKVWKSSVNRNDHRFNAFLGFSYAPPPVGDLRFKVSN